MSYTGHVPHQDPTINDIQSLDRKMAHWGESKNYITLNEAEANIFLERQISLLREQFEQLYFRFFRFRKIILEPGKTYLTVHFIYRLLNKPLDISLTGTVSCMNNQPTYHINKTRFGKMIFPRFLSLHILRPVNSLFRSPEFMKALPPVSQIKIENRLFFLFPHASPDALPSGLSSSPSPDSSGSIPDDMLLIQAADSFFLRNQYQLAVKYYQLALLKVPRSPLSDYIKKQIHLCQEQSQG
ncbi:MAG: hypothetical protein JW774_00360 [Candidatus Aureabacteria bacterium]|nr:hypothetical protein [Candidatus Auribacterota bacterium]